MTTTYFDELKPRHDTEPPDTERSGADETLQDEPIEAQQAKLLILHVWIEQRRLIDKVMNPDFLGAKKRLMESLGKEQAETWLSDFFSQEQ